MASANNDRLEGRSLGVTGFRGNYELDIEKGILREFKTFNNSLEDCCSGSGSTPPVSYTLPSLIASFDGSVNDSSNINIDITGTFDASTSVRNFFLEYLSSSGSVSFSETLSGNASYLPYNVDLSSVSDFSTLRVTASDGLNSSTPVTVDRCALVTGLIDPATVTTVTGLIQHGDGQESWTISGTAPANTTINVLDGPAGNVVSSLSGAFNTTVRVPAVPGTLYLEHSNAGCTQAGTLTSTPVNFTIDEDNCSLVISNRTAPITGITNIEYQFSVGATVVDTVNTIVTDYEWVLGALYSGDTLNIRQVVTTSSGSVSTTQSLTLPTFTDCITEFQSNTSGGGSFSPSVASSGAQPYWRMPDFTFVQGLSPNIVTGSTVGFDGTNQVIRLLPANGYSELSSPNFDSQSVVGTLDLSLFTNIGPNFIASDNPAMTQVTNPSSSASIVNYDVSNSDITGTLDLSSLTGLSTSIVANGNSNMTGITLPSISAPVSILYLENCDLTGTLDLSMLSDLGGDLQLQENANLTGITHAASTATFTRYWVNSCNLTGTLDLSMLLGLGGDFNISYNSLLTGVTNPISSVLFNRYLVNNSGLTGTLNVSTLNLSGEFSAHTNPGLTRITNPSTANIFSSYHVYGCDLTGTLDLSTLTGLGGSFRAENNANLTSIVNPSSSQTFTQYWAFNSNLTGTINLSGLTGLGGSIRLSQNSSATQITNPVSSVSVTTYEAHSSDYNYIDLTTLVFDTPDLLFYDNSMTAAETNEMLVDIESLVSATTGSENIRIDGNSTPDSTSGGFDGINAAASIAAKGYNLTTD